MLLKYALVVALSVKRAGCRALCVRPFQPVEAGSRPALPHSPQQLLSDEPPVPCHVVQHKPTDQTHGGGRPCNAGSRGCAPARPTGKPESDQTRGPCSHYQRGRP
jgi:hypothetical protein